MPDYVTSASFFSREKNRRYEAGDTVEDLPVAYYERYRLSHPGLLTLHEAQLVNVGCICSVIEDVNFTQIMLNMSVLDVQLLLQDGTARVLRGHGLDDLLHLRPLGLREGSTAAADTGAVRTMRFYDLGGETSRP